MRQFLSLRQRQCDNKQDHVVARVPSFVTFTTDKATMLEKFWQISLYVTNDAIAT